MASHIEKDDVLPRPTELATAFRARDCRYFGDGRPSSMRVIFLYLIALPLNALAVQRAPITEEPGRTWVCPDEGVSSKVTKGKMRRLVAEDGTITYVFAETSPCRKAPKTPQSASADAAPEKDGKSK